MTKRVGIIGGSGYLGVELLRLCAQHPGLDVAWATGDTQAGTPVASLYPHLASAYPGLVFGAYDPTTADGLDLVFLALPHGASQAIVPDLRKRVGVVVDLAADFRLRDASLYPTWYGEDHAAPELLADFAYGLPELFRTDLEGADAVAAPGCYPTAAALALTPLVRGGVIEPAGVVVDAASGVSGAGRGKHPFSGVDEDFSAYGLLTHRHTPEIEQATGAQVIFTPHLAPMSRGILATCYARPTASTSTGELLETLDASYSGEPFVLVSEDLPSTKATRGSNTARVTARFDERTGWVVAICALDNLVKGGSGQAVQCANAAFGFDETTGLPVTGLYP